MAGNKANFQVGLQFSADTKQAKAQMMELSKSLESLVKTNMSSGLPLTKEIKEATNAAASLKASLDGATNVNTGKLDISKFTENLKQSGYSVEQLRNHLANLGSDGIKAFQKLAVAVTSAEAPAKRLSGWMQNLLHSFAQTAKYQFTGSIYRGLISGIRSAFNYARDLNESLNNIRIVTGQSVEQMAKFAEKANDAARALSVTTTDYTNGALIFYQQGLNDEEVEKRTNVTMKLANAAGVSAETASQQLTAIWNNFAKGAENLEYYADVMVALGASTASSSSEIAEGIEKFAAIGETVGLSYEYAASALATVTATTRQSADVVGTAFKTMFARIQDLELGETLDDGTTLGKYSQALEKVGVNIKDANGELKGMDQILEEMAARWNQISHDQQVSLAQTVAGVRQYTQMMALMNNWDFMQTNLQTSYNAEGALQKQQDIYAESWEAARDRVKAAAQDIYNSLIDDEFFIDLLNGVEKLLVGIEKAIETLGGLRGVIFTIINLVTTFASGSVANAINNSIYNIRDALGLVKREAEATKKEFSNMVGSISTQAYGERIGGLVGQFAMIQSDLLAKYPKMTQQQRDYYDLLLKTLSASGDEVIKKEEELKALEQINREEERRSKHRTDAIFNSSRFQSSYDVSLNARTDAKASGDIGLVQSRLEKGQNFNLGPNGSSGQLIKAFNKLAGTLTQKELELLAELEKADKELNQVKAKEFAGQLVGEYNKVNDQLAGLEHLQKRISSGASDSRTVYSDKTMADFKSEFQNYLDSFKGGAPTELVKGFETFKNDVEKAAGNVDNIREAFQKLQLVVKGTKLYDSGEAKAHYDKLKQSISETAELMGKLQSAEDFKNTFKIVDENSLPAVKAYAKEVEEIANAMKNTDASKNLKDSLARLNQELEKGPQNIAGVRKAFEELRFTAETEKEIFGEVNNETAGLVARFGLTEEQAKILKDELNELAERIYKQARKSADAVRANKQYENSLNSLGKSADQLKGKMDWGKGITGISRAFSGLAQTITTVTSVGKQLKEGTLNFTTILTTIPSLMFGVSSAINGLKTALVSIGGPATLIIGGIVAALAAILIIVQKIKQNSPEKLAEKATEKAKELASAYNEAKQAVEAFQNTSSGYAESIEALDKLVKGTKEYEEELQKANNAAQELIETNPTELGGKWYFEGNGTIKFNDGALEDLEKAVYRGVSEASQKSITAQIEANKAQQIVDLQTLIKSDNYDYNNESQEEALTKLLEEYLYNGQSYSRAFETLSDTEQASLNQLDNVQNYIEKVAGNTLNSVEYNRQLAYDFIQYHEDWKKVNDNLRTDLEKNLFLTLAQEYKNSEDKIIAEKQKVAEKSETEDDFYSLLDDLEALIQESYIIQDENAKQQILSYIQRAFEKNNFQIKATIDDDKILINGQQIGEFVGDKLRMNTSPLIELMRSLQFSGPTVEFLDRFGYTNDHLKQLNDQLIELHNGFNSLEDAVNNTAQHFYTIFNNENDANNFYNKILKGQIDYSNLSLNQVNELLNDRQLKNQIAKDSVTSGAYKSQKSAIKALEDASKTYNEWFDSYYKSIANELPEVISNILTSNDFKNKFSQNITISIQEALEKGFRAGGTNGVKVLGDILKGQEDPAKIINLFNNTDWRITDLEELYKELTSLGVEINKNRFLDFANDLKESATQAYYLTTTLEDLFKELKSLQDIVDKLKLGSVISDEDYQKYIKNREEFKGKFVWTVSGWMYIGDKSELDTVSEDLNEIRNAYKQAREDAANIDLEDLKGTNKEIANKYSGDNFNKTAAETIGLSEDQLNKALALPFLNKNKEIINEYAEAIRNLKATEDNYAEKNLLTAAVKEQYKTVDELVNSWKDLENEWSDISEETWGQLARIAAVNEVTSKGIDTQDLQDYADYLRDTNKALADNEELLYQVAAANLIAQKAYKDTVSSYEADINTLLHDDPLGQAYANSLEHMRQNLADMLSISVENLEDITADFFTEKEIIDLYARIAEGDEIALQQLTANAMIRAGQITEEERKVYLDFLQYIADNPGTATVKAFVELYGEGAKFLLGEDKAVAIDAAGLETDRKGRQATQGSIFDYNTYKPNLEKKKSAKSKTPKLLEDEIDRYHYIRKLLADIKRELDRVDKAKERAYGAQHLKYIEQETDYLREQVGLQDRYISEIEGYLAKDRGLMAAYGAKFDAAGNISNYNELFTANFNKYANAEDSTNWENFKKALSKYEETLQLWFDETEEKAELLRQILDKQLEGIQYKVDVKIALNDRELALLEHQLNRLDDAAYDTAAALANIGEQFAVTEEKIKTNTQGIIDTLNTIPGITQDQIDRYMAGDSSAIAGLHIEQGQIEMLEQYSDALLELSDSLKQLHDDALQKVTEAFDAWGEKIEDHVAKFEHLNNVLNNYEEIIGILGRSNLGISNEFMRAMRNQEITNLQGILNTRTQAKDALAAQLADARAKAAAAATEAEREDWEEIAKDIENRLKEATESWQQAWIDALQVNKDAFDQTMQEIVDSFDNYEDELKRYDTAQDRYLETYRQAYELSKLTRDINASINDQDSIRAKKKLQDLESKIAGIKESGRAISEDELELLQKEYELRLAEIALEDAQNAKSVVRLQRDNEGNWGYVYTADQDAIEKAQSDYEDKLYDYMRKADDVAETASRTILTLNKEMAEALAALDATSADYEAKVAEVTQFYTDQLKYYEEQYGISVDAIENVAYESAKERLPEVADIIKSSNSGLQTNWDETVNAIIGGAEDLEAAVEEAEQGIITAMENTISAFKEYQQQNAETCKLAGADITYLKEHISKEFGKIGQKAASVNQSTLDLTTEMKNYLGSVLNEFGNFSSQYSDKIQIVNKANETLANSIITLERVLQNLNGSSLDTLKKAADQVEAAAQKVKEVANSTDANGKAGFDNGNGVDLTGYNYVGATADGTTLWAKYVGNGKNDIYALKNNKLTYSWSTYGRTSSFDTGGYTGEWGQSGRLAVLHEKELVLNSEDTENILDAVSLIRQITAGTAQLSYGLGNIGNVLTNVGSTSGTLDQNVSIQASFPNVTDHREIEEALTNLVNKASQYAFRPSFT